MYYFGHFPSALILFITAGIYCPENYDQSMNRFEKRLLICHNQIPTVAKKNCDWYILLNADGIANKEGNSIKFKNFKRSFKTGSFTIKLENNQRMILENQKVWGYEGLNCTIYRNFDNDFLQIEENGNLIIYSGKTKGFRGRLLTVYYFSKTLSDPVFRLDKNNIGEQFKDNACFLSKVVKRLSWPNNYAAGDNKKSSFKITEIMNECK